MISTISEMAVALGRMVELSIPGKATIILVIGLTIVMLSRRARASVRHLLLAATLAAVFALPPLAPVCAVTLARKQTAATTQAHGSQSNSNGKRVASGLDRALIRAAAEGDISGIEELLRAGANVNCTVDRGEFGSPLTAASRKGRLDAARLLLDWGADPNLLSGGTPLINAAEQGHVEIVSLLLDRGANIDLTPPAQQNALIQASEKGRLEVVKLLVARGADVNARVWAARYQLVNVEGKLVTVMSKKIEIKKDGTRKVIDDPPEKGEWRTPLSMAKRGGHKDVVDFLIASGARE